MEIYVLSNLKYVVIKKIPYPDKESPLNMIPHMYICIREDTDNIYLLKCQTYKHYHYYRNSQPTNRFVEQADPNRNPFNAKTLIDLDKVFIIDKSAALKTITPISDSFYTELLAVFNYETAEKIVL